MSEIEWKKEWFPNIPNVQKSYWISLDNRKKFLEEIAFKLKIKKPSDWGKVTKHEFRKLGGNTLISYYYSNSLFNCLKDIFKGVKIEVVTYACRYRMEERMV